MCCLPLLSNCWKYNFACISGDPDSLSSILLNMDEEEGDNSFELEHEVSAPDDKKKCPHCGKIILHRSNMRKHIKRRHSAYQCNECSEICSNKVQLRRHTNSQHTRSGYPCSQCDKTCNSKSNLDQHIRAKHNEELKPNIDEELKPNIDEELKPNIDEELKPNIEEELKPSIDEELKPNIDSLGVKQEENLKLNSDRLLAKSSCYKMCSHSIQLALGEHRRGYG